MPVALSTNQLISSLPEHIGAALLSAGQVAAHERGERLHVTGDRISELIFPLSGMVSLTLDTSEGQTVEVAITGVEGFVGTGRYLGQPLAPDNGVVQLAGEMLHVPADVVLDLASREPLLRMAIDRFMHGLMVELAQSAVCNQVHSVEQRTSRWVLHASDRAGTNDLRLTHEFLSDMLAVRRATVTNVVGIFSRAGLINGGRGLISIVDREGLRELSCECYEIVRAATPKYD